MVDNPTPPEATSSSQDPLMQELVEMMKAQRESLDQLRQTIDRQTDTIEQQTQTIEQLQQTITEKDEQIGLLNRMLFGKKSERFVSVDRQVKKKRKKDPEKAAEDKAKADAERKQNKEIKKALPEETVEHPVSEEQCQCPVCGGTEFKPMGFEESVQYEYVPSRFKKIIHRRAQKVCACGQHIVIGLAPVRVSDGVMHGPGMHAHAVVSKCLDSLPFYRLAKQFLRAGIPLSRSAICDMFHRAAELMDPIYKRMLELIPLETYVNADETRIMVQNDEKTRTAYMWVFVAGVFRLYVFSASRSGKTPVQVLGKSTGILQVDQWSAYNAVTTPKTRERAGCMGHARRKFFEAKGASPELAESVITQIRDLYEVEYDAAAEKILGTKKHLLLRQLRSKPIIEALIEQLEKESPNHLPKSGTGKAIKYFIKNKKALQLFLKDPKIPLDNNISERHLRLIALGRKNYLFVGNDTAGQNLAILQTIVATCVANNVDPQKYLTDVLIRIQTHPQSKLDELLPNNWKPPDDGVVASASSAS